MTNVRSLAVPSPAALPIEVVERKGLGHPDTLCDCLAEELSRALCRHGCDRYGFVPHHNVDKALLWGGTSEPRFGGGRVTKRIEIFIAGRATTVFGGLEVPVADLARESARRWIKDHLHALDPDRDVTLHCLVRPGSGELVDLFAGQFKGTVLANDTSIGIGFAPLTDLEAVVYGVERALTSRRLVDIHPAIGEDVKVMGIRRDRRIRLTVACALVDRYVADAADYYRRKAAIGAIALEAARRHAASPFEVEVEVNTADSEDGRRLYLTVTGTSAESGDDGQAGRGNRANGLITPYRPMTMESAAGKNPISHVGKLYNLAAGLIAARIVAELAEVSDAQCCLVSQIGRSIQEPQVVDIGLHRHDGRNVETLAPPVARIVRDQLDRLTELWRDVVAGAVGVNRWPIRTEAPKAEAVPS